MAIPLRFGILVLQNDPWPVILERACRYEALGFDTVWVADHFADPWEPARPWFEGWTLLAGLAARTSRVRIGTLVSHVVYRNPALLARQALTVDHISNGRLELGLGTGASSYDWTMTSGEEPWSLPERIGRLREAVTIVDRLLRDAAGSFDGRHYRVADVAMAPGPVQRPRPPLTIAAHGPSSVKLAAQFADTWNTAGTYWSLDPERTTPADALRVTRHLAESLDEQAVAAGRDPCTIRRSILAGFEWPVATAEPWASPDAFREFVGRYRELGFTEFVAPEPETAALPLLDVVAGEVLPALRSAQDA